MPTTVIAVLVVGARSDYVDLRMYKEIDLCKYMRIPKLV